MRGVREMMETMEKMTIKILRKCLKNAFPSSVAPRHLLPEGEGTRYRAVSESPRLAKRLGEGWVRARAAILRHFLKIPTFCARKFSPRKFSPHIFFTLATELDFVI
jgi:hypothetical protein